MAPIAVLLASPASHLLAVVSASGQYSQNFTRYDTPPVSVVQNLNVPLLMLHGTADTLVPVQEARDLDAALRQLNKPHEAIFYEGAMHPIDSKSNTPAVQADAQARMVAFFQKYLTAQ